MLASDIYLRTMGFRHVAQREYDAAPPLQRNALDSYAAGVNAYIAERKPRKLAAEFAFLGLQGVKPEIEPWTPLDSLTWPMVMSQDMAGDFAQELLRLDVVRAVGIDMARDFFAPFRYGEMPTVIHAQDLGPDAARRTAVRGPQDDLAFGGSMETGSNQWVVSGDHTESGLPGIIIGHNDHIIWGMATAGLRWRSATRSSASRDRIRTSCACARLATARS